MMETGFSSAELMSVEIKEGELQKELSKRMSTMNHKSSPFYGTKEIPDTQSCFVPHCTIQPDLSKEDNSCFLLWRTVYSHAQNYVGLS